MYEIGRAELNAAQKVFDSGRFFRYGGHETVAFEREWADRIGTESAVAVSSGTAALVTALMALRIGPGDSVLVPAYTFVSTALAVISVGAIPIYTEVDETLTMCPVDAARKARKHTACMIPVHMQGMPCKMKQLLDVARANDAVVIEDACQACGGSYKGKPLGSLGKAGVFSFNEYKILSCGEGGAVVTSDKDAAERAFMAQDGSCSVWPETGEMSQAFFCGGNFRMNELNAAILRKQAPRLDGILKRLRTARRHFISNLGLPPECKIITSNDEQGNCGVCFLIQAPTAEMAERIEDAVSGVLSAHRPINSGRHVYSHWDVVNSRIGGHHPDWDAFRHSKNKHIATNYDKPLRATDDFLSRTVLCRTPYKWTDAKLKNAVKDLNSRLGAV